MASASPTTDGIAREHRGRSGEAFEWFTGGTATSADTLSGGWKPRATSERRLRDAGHPRAEGHGHAP